MNRYLVILINVKGTLLIYRTTMQLPGFFRVCYKKAALALRISMNPVQRTSSLDAEALLDMGEAVFERYHGYSTTWTLDHFHKLSNGVPNGFPASIGAFIARLRIRRT